MRMVICVQLILEDDGTLKIAPLGYTARGVTGANVSLEELHELTKKILARATAGAEAPAAVDHEAPPLPRRQPERQMEAKIARPPSGTSIAAAEQALTGLGFLPTAAADAVRTWGASRVASVAEWARRKMAGSSVRDPVALIEKCLSGKSPQ